MGAPKTEYKPIVFDPNNINLKPDLSTPEGRVNAYLSENPIINFNANIIDVEGNKQKLLDVGIKPKDTEDTTRTTDSDGTGVTGDGRDSNLFDKIGFNKIDAIEGSKAIDALHRAKQNRNIAKASADAYKPMSELQSRSYRPLLFNKFAADQIADTRLQSKLQSGLYADPKVATQQ